MHLLHYQHTIDTYIHTYIHTYTHTYTHIHTCEITRVLPSQLLTVYGPGIYNIVSSPPLTVESCASILVRMSPFL